MVCDDNFDYEYAQIATDGYTSSDLHNIIQRSMHEMMIRTFQDSKSNASFTLEDFKKAQQDYTPVSLRTDYSATANHPGLVG